MIQISCQSTLGFGHLARGIQLGSNIPLARNEVDIIIRCLLFLLDYAHQINLDPVDAHTNNSKDTL